MNNNRNNLIRRAGIAGLVLTAALTLQGISPSGAAETYKTPTAVSTWTLDYSQPTFNLHDLATARIARVGITPIPIP
jgi:hypothetical protein